MEQSWVVSDDFKCVESHDCPMSTRAAPPGSPCRTGEGKVAVQYHTARFRLVPQLAKVLSVPTPAGHRAVTVTQEPGQPARSAQAPLGAYLGRRVAPGG